MSITHTLQDHPDVPVLAEGEMIGTWDATGSTHRKATPVQADNTSLSDGDVWVWQQSVLKATPTAVAPIDTDANFGQAGQVYGGSGSGLKNYTGALTLRGSGAPDNALGEEGWYYVDSDTEEEYGPKGEDVPDQWPVAPRLPWGRSDTHHTMTGDLDLAGGKIEDGAGETVVFVTHLNEDASDEVGLDVLMGDTDDAEPWSGIRPYTALANADLRMGGKGTGVLKNIAGLRYLTTDDSLSFGGSLSDDLDLAGFDIVDGAGQVVLQVQHANEDATDEVGLLMDMGDTDDLPLVGLRPATTIANADFHIGGKGTGVLKTTLGDEIAHAGWPLLVLKRHTNSGLLPNGSNQTILWTVTDALNDSSFDLFDASDDPATAEVAYFQFPEAGRYKIEASAAWDNGTGDGDSRMVIVPGGTGGVIYGINYFWGPTVRANRTGGMTRSWIIDATEATTVQVYMAAFTAAASWAANDGMLVVRRIA